MKEKIRDNYTACFLSTNQANMYIKWWSDRICDTNSNAGYWDLIKDLYLAAEEVLNEEIS